MFEKKREGAITLGISHLKPPSESPSGVPGTDDKVLVQPSASPSRGDTRPALATRATPSPKRTSATKARRVFQQAVAAVARPGQRAPTG